MTRIIEKRLSLHKNLAKQQEQNQTLQYQIGQLQALANLGVTTCMIAHEINNLLTPLSNYAALALNHREDVSLTEKALQKTVRNCERAGKIMQSILDVANGEVEEKKETGLRGLVEEIFSCLCRDFSKDKITVKIEVPEDLTIWAIPVQIQQVIMNLILNARDAMLERGGFLIIKGQDFSNMTAIEVCDTGGGIEAGNLRKIFEPFFTTKGDKKSTSKNSGYGLGLAFCKKIIEEHGGSICVESELGQGTAFKITLPKLQ